MSLLLILTANQQTSKLALMKTTIDLPPDLVKKMKLRAVNEGRKLKDVAADLLERGFATEEKVKLPFSPSVVIETNSNGLPVVICRKNSPASRMTIEELLTLEQETLHQEDLQRLGHPL